MLGSAAAAANSISLLQQKEQEISLLREHALRELETKVQGKERELESVTFKFQKLRDDFEYNMKLLEERDVELEKYDTEHDELAASLADRDAKLSDMLDALTQTQAELKAERAGRKEVEFVFQAKRAELQHFLDDQKVSHSQALIQQRKAGEADRRSLQRALVEAEEEVGRQRREMASEFQVQSQHREAESRKQVEDAKQEAKVAQQLSWQRENEAKAAYGREAEQRKLAEAAAADAKEKEKAMRALSWELEQTRELKDDQIRDQCEQLETLKHQLKILNDESLGRQGDLAARLADSQRSLEAMRLDTAASAARQQSQHREEVAIVRAKLEQSQAHVAELTAAALQLEESLKYCKTEAEDRIAALEQELRLQREAADMALSDSERRLEVLVHALEGELTERGAAIQRWQDKSDGLTKAMSERTAQLVTAKDQLAKAGMHERELKRKLEVVEGFLEEAGDNREAVVEAQTAGQLRALRDELQDATLSLKDTRTRLSDKESEILRLRDRVHSLSSTAHQADSDAELAERGLGAAGGQGSPVDSPPRLQKHVYRVGGKVNGYADTMAGSPHSRPPRLSLSPTQDDRMHESQDSLPNLPDMLRMIDQGLGMASPSVASLAGPDNSPWPLSPLGGRRPGAPGQAPPSPLGDFSPRGSSSPRGFWLGPYGLGGPVDATTAAAAGAAAARAAEYLRASQDSMDDLLRQPIAASKSFENALESVEEESVKEALRDADAQNERLRSTLAMMREEMEALQSAALAAAQSIAVPHDLALMKAELEESDHDLAQAMKHIQVLQMQLGRGDGTSETPTPSSPDFSAALNSAWGVAAAPSPTATTSQPGTGLEISYLRERVQNLVAENRQLRRQAVQLKLAAVAATNRQRATNNDLSPGGVATPYLAPGHQLGGPSPDRMQTGGLSIPTLLEGATEQQQTQGTATTSFIVPGATAQPSLTSAAAFLSAPGTAGPNTLGIAPGSDIAAQQKQALASLSSGLAAARSQLVRLREENEKLMEMGSALRSERDRLAVQLAAALSAEEDLDESMDSLAGPAGGLFLGYHYGAPSPSAPDLLWHRHVGSVATTALGGGRSTLSLNPGQALMAAAAFSGPSSGLSFGGAAPPTYFTSDPSPLAPAAPFASPPRQGPASASRPSSSAETVLTAATATAHRQATNQELEERASDPAAANQEGGKHGGNEWQAQHHSGGPSPEDNEEGKRLSSSSLQFRPSVHFSDGPGSGDSVLLEGPYVTSITAAARPPSAVPGSASSRMTESQREKLKEMQQKREEQQAVQVAILNKPKVRNYNMRDESGG